MTGTNLAGRAFGLYGMCEGAPSLCMCGDSSGSDCRIRRKLRELNGCRVWSLIAAGRKLTTRTECGLRTILAPVCCYVRYPGEAPFLSGAIRFVAVVLRIVRMARMKVDYLTISFYRTASGRFVLSRQMRASIRCVFRSIRKQFQQKLRAERG